ncbi:hypothetical protein GSS88_01130 [Corynebacterium sp. 3HC-13]|nr:hypothetical protein [Corynebacterium poyangense]MBZ8176405.1 hypothetical protein [Corynebacterium poyangense]
MDVSVDGAEGIPSLVNNGFHSHAFGAEFCGSALFLAPGLTILHGDRGPALNCPYGAVAFLAVSRAVKPGRRRTSVEVCLGLKL